MYYKRQLSNGIKIIGEKIPHVHSVAMGILVNAGLARESDVEQGISHFVEHMFFKGTVERSAFKIACELDEIGGRLNAFTTKEFTMYHCVVLDKYLNKAFDVLSDIFNNSLINAEDVDTERKVILEELKMSLDASDDYVHDLFIDNLWKEHLLGRMILGSEKSINTIDVEMIKNYIDCHYSADNIVISVAGNFDIDEFVALAEEKLGNLSKGANSVDYTFGDFKDKVLTVKRDSEQVNMCLGANAISYNSPDRFKLSLLNSIVGGAMSSRLFQEIREKRGLAYSVYSYYAYYKNAGYYAVYAGTALENCKEVAFLIRDILAGVEENGVTEEEFVRAQDNIRGNVILSLETSSARMKWNAKNYFYTGDVFSVKKIYDEIGSISLESLNNFAANLYKQDNLTLTALGPFENLSDLEGVLC